MTATTAKPETDQQEHQQQEIQELLRQNAELSLMGKMFRTLQGAQLVDTVQNDDRRFRDLSYSTTTKAMDCTGLGDCDVREKALKDEDMQVKWNSPETHQHFPPAASPPAASPLSKLIGPALIAASIFGTGGLGAGAWLLGKALEQRSQIVTPTTTDQKLDIQFIGGLNESDSELSGSRGLSPDQ